MKNGTYPKGGSKHFKLDTDTFEMRFFGRYNARVKRVVRQRRDLAGVRFGFDNFEKIPKTGYSYGSEHYGVRYHRQSGFEASRSKTAPVLDKRKRSIAD